MPESTVPGPSILARLTALVVLAAAVFVAALFIGTSGITLEQALHAFTAGSDDSVRAVIFEVRLPRLLAAFGVGGLLAMTGVLLQALFRNPLADPFVLGVSGGAAVGSLLAMLAGATVVLIQTSAVLGALAAVATVYLLARDGGTSRLLLTGVVLASACGAFTSVLLSVADSVRLRGMVFWLAGDLSWAQSPSLSVLATVLAVALSILLARPLNVLASGELRARSVGLDVERWRTIVFVVCATMTAIAVVSAGTVGFVGLITPHAVRLIFRTSDHRIVAPASALLGGTLLAAADVVARIAASPRQLPVGAIMALVGAPLFIALLRQRSRSA
jgi:iron complex transport system permease protein